jgi:hypothetical protein
MHPVPMCPKYEDCKTFKCTSRHGKTRTRKCIQGGSCENGSCHFLHPTKQATSAGAQPSVSRAKNKKSDPPKVVKKAPVKAFASVSSLSPKKGDGVSQQQRGPCSRKENCVNFSCTFSHPTTRPPPCPEGAECHFSLCLRLHPPQALDQRLLKKASHGLGGHFQSIIEARKAHRDKLNAVAAESFKLLQQAPKQTAEKRQEHKAIRQAVEAQALELSQQLRNCDNAILQCIDCVATTSDDASNLLTMKDDMAQEDFNAHSKIQKHRIKSAKMRIFRELYRLKLALPALSLRAAIEKEVTASQFVVIQGATGSG